MPLTWKTVKKTIAEKSVSRVGPSRIDVKSYEDVFDPEFYREQLGRPGLSDSKALRHYLSEGWRTGLDPSASFSTRSYLDAHADVREAGMNPLTHYVLHGVQEMRPMKLVHEYNGRIDDLQLNAIRGWSVDVSAPDRIFDINVLIDGLFYTTVKTNQPRSDLLGLGISQGLGGFDVDVPFNFLEPGEHLVAIEMPDGSLKTKTIETPVWGAISIPRPQEDKSDVPLRIVVPIYNAAEDFAICLDRLKAYTPQNIEIILIDDCSPDSTIRKILATVQDNPQFRVLSNKKNIGFTSTVNRGLQEAQGADVIILNSDARVTPKWTEGMRAAAYSRPNVATVTAMSDRAGAFSAPNIGNDNALPSGVDEADFARAFRRRSLRLYPEVPTGNGFCMYIRRAGLDALGSLDDKAFPRGYGEENDYCMRALQMGWVNLIDDATYVFHERTKSFGEAKTENITKGRAVIDKRYPEYKFLIQRYHTSSLIKAARYQARLALSDCSNGKGVLPRALFVIATQTGGTPQTNADLMGALDDALETWVLRCSSRVLELSRYEDGTMMTVRKHTLSEAIEPANHRSSEYDAVVAEWLRWLDVDIVHIRHLGWHSLSLPALAKKSGARVFYSLHDFYTLCPSLKLLDENNTFCGGKCTATNGTCQIELWNADALPDIKNSWIHQWRDKMAKAIECCDGFITTSPSARQRVLEHLPSIPEDRFHVIPHGRDFARFEQLQHLPSLQEPIRILVPGNIDNAKGLQVISQVLSLDVLGMFEFHVLGTVNKRQMIGDIPRLIEHHKYRREDFGQKVRDIAPHFGAVFSIWDETFCHTLTEMWSVGLPVAVLDFPTLRDRVENSGAGWIMEDLKPESIHAALTKIANDPAEMKAKGDAAVAWQSRRGAGQSCRQMAARYLDVYRMLTTEAPVPNVAVVVPADKGLKSANASSEIRVWERTRNSVDRPINYIRMDIDGLLANMEMGTVSGAIIQRTAIPARVINKLIETAKINGVPYVYEIDDNLLEVPADKDADGFYASYAPFISELISNAAAVTVSTELLAAKIRPHNDQVEIVPNKISLRLWAGLQPDKIEHMPRLLYMGTRTHDEDLAFVLLAIELARATYPTLRLSLIGVTSNADLPDWVDVIPIEDENKSYSQFVPWIKTQVRDVDLGIAPLMKSEFNRFKSGLKVLDYAALGLPVIASQVPSYKDILGLRPPEGVILIANSVEVWAQTIVSEIRRSRVLHERGLQLRSWAFKNHALEPSLSEYDDFVLRTIS